MTGSRLAQAQKYIGNETFMLTYGDGVSDINIDKLLDSHKKSKCLATVTAVQPKGRFGTLLFNKTVGGVIVKKKLKVLRKNHAVMGVG